MNNQCLFLILIRANSTLTEFLANVAVKTPSISKTQRTARREAKFRRRISYTNKKEETLLKVIQEFARYLAQSRNSLLGSAFMIRKKKKKGREQENGCS